MTVEAIIALVGVVVGATATGVVDYFLQRQRGRETSLREQEAEERLARAAALVAAMELAEEEVALSAGGAIPTRRQPVWPERRELLAQHLGPVHAFPVALVFSMVDRARDTPERERDTLVEASRRLFDFARVDILLAYATGKPLPPQEFVDAALVAVGSQPLTRWLSSEL
jgi:hypothetical protein